MKKALLTVACAVGISSLASAAVINWGVGPIQIKDWAGVVQVGTTVELVFAGNIGGDSGEWVYETRTATTQTSAAGGRVNVSPLVPSINIGEEVAGSGQSLTTGESQFFVRIYHLDGLHYIDSNLFTFNAASDNDNNYWAAGSVGTAGAENDGIHSRWGDAGNWEVIPEPASAGLLALGLAAVALRRRRVA